MAVTDTNNSQNLEITQGVTAQTWAGPAMAANGGTLGNASKAPAGLPSSGESPSPYELTYATNAPVGWATQAGEDDSTYLTDENSGSNATPMGGGNGPSANFGYENSALLGGTSQSWNAVGEQIDAISVTVNQSYSVSHTAGGTVSPAITGGTSPYTVTLLDGSLPAGVTLAASTGVLTVADTGATPGAYDLAFKVTDSASPDAHEAEYGFVLNIT